MLNCDKLNLLIVDDSEVKSFFPLADAVCNVLFS